MARPTRRRGTDNHQFRKRVPADIFAKARGQRVAFRLPEDNGREIIVGATVGQEISFSLHTPDKAVAKERQAAALLQFDQWCDSIRSGPRPLTHKQRVGLSGLLYRAFADNLEDDPGAPEIWAAVKAANEHAMYGSGLGIYDSDADMRREMLEQRFGKLVDLLFATAFMRASRPGQLSEFKITRNQI
jgi:hypothetical protein